jgi:dTDP-glucose 4,6-dehydratase
MDESHPLNPQSPYAASKVGADKLAESFFRSYQLPVVILRPFNTYGPRQSPRAVIPTIIIQALKSRKIRLGSLNPTRDLTFVKDTARGFLAAATAPDVAGKTIQLGTQKEYSVADLVALIGNIVDKELQVIQEAERRRPASSEVERLFASNKNAKNLLKWEPKFSIRKGLEQTVRWFQNRGELYKTSLYHI